jgi:ABC-type amino acid transport substrate-binding protein
MLSIPVQTREVGKLKKHLSPVTVLLLLAIVLLPTLGACSATTSQTSATVYGEGMDQMTAAAKAADAAVASVAKSPNIQVPATTQGGKLFVGSDASYPPLEYLAKVITAANQKGTIGAVGFEIDLARAVAKKLGLEVTFMTVDWDSLAAELNQSKIDMVASGMVTSSALLASLSASDIYLSADLAICTQAGVQLADGAALKGKTVAVQAGSTAQTVVSAIEGVGTPKSYPRILGAFADLKDGKVDAVVIEQPAAKWVLDNHAAYAAALKVTGTIKTDQGYAFWCKKDKQELVDAINAALKELREAPVAIATTTTLGGPTTTAGASATTAGASTTTTAAAPGTTAGVTTTAPTSTPQTKSVYQLLCEKWGVTGN